MTTQGQLVQTAVVPFNPAGATSSGSFIPLPNPWARGNGFLTALLLGCGLVIASVASPAFAASTLRPERLAEMDAAIEQAIATRKCPGGVLWVEHGGESYHKAFGHRALVPAEEPMTEDTLFDMASLTKVMATTPSIMLLWERGKLGLDDPVAKYIPEFAAHGKEGITLRQLLTHTSGLRPDISLKPDWTGYDEAIRLCCEEKLSAPPGEKLIYSDTGMILLGEIVRRVAGEPLDQFARREIYEPLGMKDTGFNPPKSKLDRIAPTEVEDGRPVRGVVHDPRARRMGGVAGHAGLFSTAADVARYARMLLNGGELDGVRLFKPETVKLMTSVQTPDNISGRRGLGWDIGSGYSGPRGKIFPLGSYGHTGWTGTSLWIDPFSKTFVIFLSNRNHPTEAGNVGALRAQLGTLAAEAVTDFDFANVPGALPERRGPVLNGIDVLVKHHFAPLQGKRVGLITNHTGHDRERNPTIDLLRHAPGVTLVKLFSPEHGIRGALDENVSDSRDERTGLPIHSLYGATRKPTAEQLQDLDALVFDIQDVGCRFYTYPSTLGLAIEAAAEHDKEIFVLDRVNPINGVAVEGPVLAEPPTFVGFYKVPLRHGLTVGELAKMYNAEKNLKARLTVIEIENWRRGEWFDETGLPWTNPSPNMRNLKQAILYPGIGLLESALSVGRGTDTPFEVVGAPYIDDVKFAEELNRARLPGVSFVPIRFTPTASVHKGRNCGGVYIMLNDRDHGNAVDVGLQMALTLHRLYPTEFNPDRMKHLLLHPPTLAAIKAGKTLREIHATWEAGREEFERRRAKFLLYR
jgi:uncharacterized protein YbbC (DUF1343 family)/CubicO group peptidase (beta-lactamase class C family)